MKHILAILATFLFFIGCGQLVAQQADQRDQKSDAKQAEHAKEKTAVEPIKKSDVEELVNAAAGRLLELQEEDGAWPYEGVYRVRPAGIRRPTRKDFVIPVGYRIGGSSIVCSSLISAKLKDRSKIKAAVARSTKLILDELEDPLMEPTIRDSYDVRVWGHIYALDYFCRLDDTKGFEELKKSTGPWIQKLVDALVLEEIKGGGWNYANQRRHACFVTSPALQALMLARQSGASVPDVVLERGAEVLKNTRNNRTGAFQYSGTAGRDTLPGSIARGPASEATMLLLGGGDTEKLQAAINAFHVHWDELEKRRKKTGTHVPPHGVAPYYFYYGHRYLAQAIKMLPKEKQDDEFQKFLQVLMKTKDPDNTWNDRVFDRSKAYGTAMSLLALSRENVLLPKKIKLQPKNADAPKADAVDSTNAK